MHEHVERKVGLPTKEEALRSLDVIEQQVRQTGRVDTEPDMFQNIRHALEADTITPKEAIIRAGKILEERQDYN